VAAGAINSPQLLELSGVGRADAANSVSNSGASPIARRRERELKDHIAVCRIATARGDGRETISSPRFIGKCRRALQLRAGTAEGPPIA